MDERCWVIENDEKHADDEYEEDQYEHHEHHEHDDRDDSDSIKTFNKQLGVVKASFKNHVDLPWRRSSVDTKVAGIEDIL